jgi:hypothetical protein
MLAVSKEHRTRAFQALFGKYRLIGLQFKFGLHGAVGPDDPRHIALGLFAQSEMHQGLRDDLFLEQQAGANLHLAADAE